MAGSMLSSMVVGSELFSTMAGSTLSSNHQNPLQDVSSVVYIWLSYRRCSGYTKSNPRMPGEKKTPGPGGVAKRGKVTEVL